MQGGRTPPRRRGRQGVKRSRTIRFDLSEGEFGEIQAAAEQAGLAKGAFVAQAALAVARGGGLPPDSPQRQALSEFIRAAGLVRRIGVNLNQAERAALLTGRDDDFTLILTLAYTGLRWGEVIGLEHGYVHPSEIRVEWQIREVGGKFYRIPPKDDSYRSPDWEPCLPVDLPPFLAALLARQAPSCPRRGCACIAEHGGSGRHVFPSPDGRHHRRSNYGPRVFRPACDGRHEPVNGGRPRIVTVDATTWPGVPLASWPAVAQSGDGRSTPERYVPPRGRGGSGSFRMAFRWPPGYR
jgi:hypothetical protein